MAKIQIIVALTLDGFLPEENEMLMRWVEENTRHGFPHWKEKASFLIYPRYGLMDLMDTKNRHGKDCIYLAEVRDGKSAEYAGGLLRYHLVDELVIYRLPLSCGNGISLSEDFSLCRWELLACKVFPNGICRMVYGKKG